MFGFAGVVAKNESWVPDSNRYPELLEGSGCRFQYKLIVAGDFPHKQTFSCSEDVSITVLGLFYPRVRHLRSLDEFEEIADGAFTGLAITPKGFRVYTDPCGWRSVYFRQHGELLYLASNIRYFREHLDLKLEPVPERAVDFLCTSFIPGIETLTKDVFQLPMGQALEWSGHDEMKIRDYCQYSGIQKKNTDISTSASELHSICLENTSKIKEASGFQECTVFLSGGLDSTCALSVAMEVFGKENVHAISVHFGDHLPNENEYIDEAVGYFGCQHQYLEIAPASFLQEMDAIYKWIDDPVGDPVVMPNYLMNHEIGIGERLVITGEGGDPCFGGPKNVFMSTSMGFKDLYGDAGNNEFIVNCYLESFKRAYDDAEQLSSLDCSRFHNRMSILISKLDPYLNNADWDSFLDRLLFANKYLKSNSLILPKVQKTTQPFSRYSLSPLFSRTIIEFCARTPIETKYPDLKEKFILKEAFRRKIPDSIIDREKSGMRVPLRFWQEKKIQDFNWNILLRKNKKMTSRFFNLKQVKELLKGSRPRKGLKSWMLTTFVLTAKNLYEPTS